MNSDELAISVVVPVYDNADVIGDVVRAFLTQEGLRSPFELVIVDDASRDDPRQAIGPLLEDARVVLVRNETNLGAAATRNRGLDLARGRIVVLSDGDCVPAPGFLRAHETAHEERSHVDTAVLGQIEYPPAVTVTPLMRLGNVVEFWTAPGVGETSTDFKLFHTTNISLKREFVSERFDAELFSMSGWEDNEMGWRMARRGLRFASAPLAISYHHHFLGPEEFLEKCYRYGRLLSRWMAACSAEERQELERRFRPRAGGGSGLGTRLMVNRITFPIVRALAAWTEAWGPAFSASLYWKLYPFLFERGFRNRAVAGVRDALGDR